MSKEQEREELHRTIRQIKLRTAIDEIVFDLEGGTL